MNQCTIVQTTVCETMVSTGAPVPSYGPPPGSSLPYEGTEKTEYPLPTDQQSSSGNENASNTHSTEGGIETATSTGGEEEPSDTASATETEPTETDAPSSGYALPFNVVLAYAFTAMLLL